jgi:hypothetical protein
MSVTDKNLAINTKEAYIKSNSSINMIKPLLFIEFSNILKINKRQITKQDLNTFSIHYIDSTKSLSNNQKILKESFYQIKEIKLKCDSRTELDYYLKIFSELKFKKFEFKNCIATSLDSYLEEISANSVSDKLTLNPDKFFVCVSNVEIVIKSIYFREFFEKIKINSDFKEDKPEVILKSDYELARVESFEEEYDSNDYVNVNEQDIIMFDSN